MRVRAISARTRVNCEDVDDVMHERTHYDDDALARFCFRRCVGRCVAAATRRSRALGSCHAQARVRLSHSYIKNQPHQHRPDDDQLTSTAQLTNTHYSHKYTHTTHKASTRAKPNKHTHYTRVCMNGRTRDDDHTHGYRVCVCV